MDYNHDGANAAEPKLTAEAAGQFQEGINLTLARWTALQLFVQNQWGGPHSHLRPQQILMDIFSLFTSSKEKVYVGDVDGKLAEAMLSLGVVVEDGSIEEIADKFMVMHEECLEGNFSSIQMLRATNPPRGAAASVAEIVDKSDIDDNEDDGDDVNMVEENSLEMVIDGTSSHTILNRMEVMVDDSRPKQSAEAEDGWTVVSTRRNKGRRN